MEKKFNALMVSGLIIGPILGSGIVFLPPLAYGKLGEYAIFAWVIMMILGALFAYVFAKMAASVSDNQGISTIVGSMLGDRFRVLSANYLTLAVCFGPVAVALTAAEFVQSVMPREIDVSLMVIAGAVLLVCAALVLSNVSFLGKFMVMLSSITAILLLVGSIATLFGAPASHLSGEIPDTKAFGQTLLLIFWSIIGWEVLGNYVEDVRNPARTIMRAMKISLVAIVLIYLLTAFALQTSHSSAVSNLLLPIFDRFAAPVFGMIAVCLCVCTIVAVTGAVARQTMARLRSSNAPALLQKKVVAVAALLVVNLVVLALNAAGLLSFEQIVATANTLFIANACLGLIGGFRMIRGVFVRIGICVLILMLLLLLVFSPLYAIVLFVLVTGLSVWILPSLQKNKARKQTEQVHD